MLDSTEHTGKTRCIDNSVIISKFPQIFNLPPFFSFFEARVLLADSQVSEISLLNCMLTHLDTWNAVISESLGWKRPPGRS